MTSATRFESTTSSPSTRPQSRRRSRSCESPALIPTRGPARSLSRFGRRRLHHALMLHHVAHHHLLHRHPALHHVLMLCALLGRHLAEVPPVHHWAHHRPA